MRLLISLSLLLACTACASGEPRVVLGGETFRVEIADSGKGIDPDDLPRIFDPFFTTKDKGTGLGLAIVYNIIKKHHGKIDVARNKGKGTCFIITIPGVE